MTKITGFIAAALFVAATSASALAASTSPTAAPSTTAAPATAAPAAPKAMHHAAMSSARVKEIQSALNNNGEQVAVDGLWGSKTRAAVKDFQQKHGIKATGHADTATLQQLKVSSKA